MKKLFTNAVIYSPAKLRADCIAVDNGRIMEIGPKSKLINLRRHGFKAVDLKGKTVLPGFIDSHLHFLGTGYHLMNIDLDNINSLDKALIKIKSAARKAAPGQWLLGRGWNKNNWGNILPDKSSLDAVCPNNPIRLFSKDGHTLWVNSLALKVCEIGFSTPDPDGGSIQRDIKGDPTGILFENACDLITDRIPEASTAFKMKALKKAVKMLNRYGITGVGDCDWDIDRLSLFNLAREKGILNLRVFMMLSPNDIDSAAQLGLALVQTVRRADGNSQEIDAGLGHKPLDVIGIGKALAACAEFLVLGPTSHVSQFRLYGSADGVCGTHDQARGDDILLNGQAGAIVHDVRKAPGQGLDAVLVILPVV